MRTATLRSGFTMREMAVIITVLALLFTVLIPGCANSRDSVATRTACRNQMKMQVLALQNHHDSFKTFPPLFFSQDPDKIATLSPLEAAECYSWQVRLLPFVEEAALFKGIATASQNFALPASQIKVSHTDGKEASPATLVMQHLICPAVPDPVAPGSSHYAALSATRLPLLLETDVDAKGQPRYKHPPEGLLVADVQSRGQPVSRMADGTSKTTVLAESRESARSNWFQPQQAFVVGFLPEDSTATNDSAGPPYYPYFVHKNSTLVFDPKSSARTAINYGPTSDKPSQGYHAVKGDPLERNWGPSSAHGGGIVVHGMGDGSVLEVKNDVDPKVYFAAITARGAENVVGLGF